MPAVVDGVKHASDAVVEGASKSAHFVEEQAKHAADATAKAAQARAPRSPRASCVAWRG